MTLDEAVAYYNSGYALCKALRIAPQNVSSWRKKGGIIPQGQQFRLEKLTQGKLKADTTMIVRRHKKRLINCPHCKIEIDLDEPT